MVAVVVDVCLFTARDPGREEPSSGSWCVHACAHACVRRLWQQVWQKAVAVLKICTLVGQFTRRL